MAKEEDERPTEDATRQPLQPTTLNGDSFDPVNRA
jgi:hypothetical protein